MANSTLPTFQSDIREFQLMQSNWASAINPILAAPANKSILLKNISLVIGANTVNHGLGRQLQGWTIIRKRAPGNVYDTQDQNLMPALTLTLVSDAAMVVDLEVF